MSQFVPGMPIDYDAVLADLTARKKGLDVAIAILEARKSPAAVALERLGGLKGGGLEPKSFHL
jgi:hypothetical protein